MKPASKFFLPFSIIVVLFLLSACTNFVPVEIAEELPTNTPTLSPTDIPIPTTLPTSTLINTPLPSATSTPQPSNTPTPTNTVTPEPTATPSEEPITDFEFVAKILEVPELGITVQHPLSWFGAPNLDMGGILLADDFDAFTQGDANADAIGIFIVVVPDATGPTDEILDSIVARFANITEQVSSTTIEEIDGQEFAWAEYTAESDDGSEVHYFMAAVTNGMRSVAAFTSVYSDRQDEVRVIYQAIVERIELHDTTESGNN